MATAVAAGREALFSPKSAAAVEAAERARLADLSSAAAKAAEELRLAKEVANEAAAARAAEETGRTPGSAALFLPVPVEQVPKKKWPKVFPEFVGRGYFEGRKEAGHGVGRCCTETSYTDYEASTTDPTVFRMKYHNKVLNFGDDPSAEQAARVGIREVSWRYFRADHDRGCFELLGGEDLLDECEMIVKGDNQGTKIVPFSLWKSDHECNGDGTAGGWTFRTNTRQRLQLVLSDDFTVLRGVNRADQTTGADKAGDFLESASYRFARAPRAPGQGRKLAEDLVPLADDTKEKIKLLARIFRDGNEFRKEDAQGKLTVKVDARFVKVNRIDTLDDQFGAEAKVVFEFQITKHDAAQYVSAGDNKAGWVPAGAPMPVFEELNQAVGVDAAQVKIVSSPFTLHRRDESRMVARQTITITGDFYECFELESYPFDSQPLRIQLRTTGTMPVEGFEFVHGVLFEDHECASGQRGMRLPTYVRWKKGEEGTFQSNPDPYEEPSAWEFVCAGEALDPQHSAWECDIKSLPKMMVEFKKRSDEGNRLQSIEGENVMGVLRVTLAILVVRKSSVYVKRVMATLAGFALLAIFSFATEGDNATESILTVMLTAVAYSVVIAEDIPKLGYLTFLDKYVLGLTMGFMLLLSWVMWANAVGDHHNIEEDFCCWAALWIFTTMYFVGHITLYAYVQLWVFPAEAKKYDPKLFLGDCLIDYKAEKKKKKASMSWPWGRAAKETQQAKIEEDLISKLAGAPPDVQRKIVEHLTPSRLRTPRKRLDFDQRESTL
jgi:hypothetical protein